METSLLLPRCASLAFQVHSLTVNTMTANGRITDVEHNLRNLTGLNRFKPYNPSTKEKTDFVFPRTKNLSEEQWIRLIELLCSVHYFACHYYRNSDIYLDQDLIDSLFTAEEQAGCPFKTKDKVTFFGITALCSVFVSKPTILYFLSYIQNIPGFEISPNTNKANLGRQCGFIMMREDN